MVFIDHSLFIPSPYSGRAKLGPFFLFRVDRGTGGETAVAPSLPLLYHIAMPVTADRPAGTVRRRKRRRRRLQPGEQDVSISIDQTFVDTVRAIAERAGKEILEVYGTDFDVSRKDDSSPVTEADERAERLIIDAIRGEIGEAYPIVAEEAVAGGDIPDVGDQPFWLVDPLDGTKQFVKRQGEFTVNIALIENRRPLLGVVHAPALSVTYWGSPLGAFAADDGQAAHPIACRPMPARGLIAVASRSHRNAETDAFLARYDLADSISAGSSIKFCLVAAGKADVYPRTGRTMEWDTAAGHAVVRFAGGTVCNLDGAELLYAKPGFENPYFVVSGPPAT